MRKTLQKCLVASLLLTAPVGVMAQPTFQLLGELNVGGISNQPTDFYFHDGDLYIASFSGNRNIARVNDVLTTDPSLSTVAFTAAPTSEGADAGTANGPFHYQNGRGLTSIQVHPEGRILVAGDAGSPDLGYSAQVVAEYTLGGALIRQMVVSDSSISRINAAVYFGESILLARILGAVTHVSADLTTLADPAQVSGWPNFTRGIAFVGDDIFIRTTSNGTDRVHRLTGGSIGSLSDYFWEGFQFAELGAQTFSTSAGIKTFEYQGANPRTYVVAIHVGNPTADPPVPPQVHFYDPATEIEEYPTTPLFLLDTEDFGAGGLLGVAFTTTPEGQYMFLSRPNGPYPNTVQVWGIDGAELIDILPPGELGDINGDGTINVADVTELANLIAANNEPPLEVGDIDGDGFVTEADIQALADLIAD